MAQWWRIRNLERRSCRYLLFLRARQYAAAESAAPDEDSGRYFTHNVDSHYAAISSLIFYLFIYLFMNLARSYFVSYNISDASYNYYYYYSKVIYQTRNKNRNNKNGTRESAYRQQQPSNAAAQ